jgi:hypothetical protein
VEFNGTGFDARGAIQLGALRPGLISYPVSVTNIVIGLPGQAVRLLLTTVYTVAPETPVAECVFHLADGRSQRLRLLYGSHLACCISRDDEPVARLRDGEIACSIRVSEGKTARLYQSEWQNPAADQRIESMDFLAGAGNAGPILVAVSIKQGL